MPTTIIKAYPNFKRIPADDGSKILHIAECFADTVQGENFAGYPSTFLRMQRCTLNCSWCDSTEVWRKGNPYSSKELLNIFDETETSKKLINGQHLILTGGSPILQQDGITEFLDLFIKKYKAKPFVEIENECVLMPSKGLLNYVDRWNNSPKTSNSNMKERIRYKPEVLEFLSSCKDSWFKFVISDKNDWDEIEKDFLRPNLIRKEQIVLMPEGINRKQLQKNYQKVMDICIRENVRMTDRFQITVFNQVVSV